MKREWNARWVAFQRNKTEQQQQIYTKKYNLKWKNELVKNEYNEGCRSFLVSASFPLYRKSIRCFDHYRKFRRISLSSFLSFSWVLCICLFVFIRPTLFECVHLRHKVHDIIVIVIKMSLKFHIMKFIMMENFCHLSIMNISNVHLKCHIHYVIKWKFP